MALRSAGLDPTQKGRVSLEAIASELGVSRETVRRARNDLRQLMPLLPGTMHEMIYAPLAEPAAVTAATARALRRLLTMIGPQPWDQVLSAWGRARGKRPYLPLPADEATVRAWARDAGGLAVSPGDGANSLTVRTLHPEALDQVSQFLLEALGPHTGGVHRNLLLATADAAGLSHATIATTLSMHPAVIRLGPGIWALRGPSPSKLGGTGGAIAPRRNQRTRPTAFAWGPDGSLLIDFSIPFGPSPVVAVPKAVSELVEGRKFGVPTVDKRVLLTVKNARLWGFGPLLSELGLPGGARATIALNLLACTATIAPAKAKDVSR